MTHTAAPSRYDTMAYRHCGRSGLKRAVLGSVSDQVVRHASCPVVVTS